MRRAYADTHFAQGTPDPGQNQQAGAPRAANRPKSAARTLCHAAREPHGERIPLTIADTDPAQGTITIVYLVMGKTTAMLEELNQGDAVLDVCGPLGTPPTLKSTAP